MNGINYKIEPFLVCDMACLVTVLGLYDVFHPSSHWKCCWCHASALNIADFTIHKWELRDINKMVEKGVSLANKTEAQQKKFATTNFGQQKPPILQFLLSHTVPCMLHVLMALTKTLFKHLTSEAEANIEYEQALIKLLTKIGVKMANKKTKSKTRTWSQILTKSRLNRNHLLAILENYEQFLVIYNKYSKQATDIKSRCNLLWRQYFYLMAKALQEKSDVTEEWWLTHTKMFATNFKTVFYELAVTPYMHVFVYHLGFYLEKYGSVEIFANYATEGRHRYNKRVIVSATNGWAHRGGRDNDLTKQLLTHSFRDDKLSVEKKDYTPAAKKQRVYNTKHTTEKCWSDRVLSVCANKSFPL